MLPLTFQVFLSACGHVTVKAFVAGFLSFHNSVYASMLSGLLRVYRDVFRRRLTGVRFWFSSGPLKAVAGQSCQPYACFC